MAISILSNLNILLLTGAALLGQREATSLSTIKLIPNETGLRVVLEADGSLRYRVLEEETSTTRLVLELDGVASSLQDYEPPTPHPLLEHIQMESVGPRGEGATATRVIFGLKVPLTHHIEVEGDELHVDFESLAGSPQAPASRVTGPAHLGIPSPLDITPADIDASLFFGPIPQEAERYRLGAEDVVEIRVFELEQLNQTVTVSGDGQIDLPLVGTIPVQGLNADEVAEEVARRLGDGFVQNPRVNVVITDFQSQRISVLGAVRNPATYTLATPRRLLRVLADAGSLSPEAGPILYVFRQTPDGRSARLTVPLNELLVNGDPRWNLFLLPGDVVSVPPAEAISVSVLGAVNGPGLYKLPGGDGATLTMAIAMAGGLNRRASDKGVRITRTERSGEQTVFEVNLGDIFAGKRPNVILQEGDIIVVKESFF